MVREWCFNFVKQRCVVGRAEMLEGVVRTGKVTPSNLDEPRRYG